MRSRAVSFAYTTLEGELIEAILASYGVGVRSLRLHADPALPTTAPRKLAAIMRKIPELISPPMDGATISFIVRLGFA